MRKEKMFHGSITVEAAFVMPIVIFIIFIIINLAMYLHDKCLIQGIADGVYHRASMDREWEGNRSGWFEEAAMIEIRETELEHTLEDKLSEGLRYSRVTKMEVQVNPTEISVSVRAETKAASPIFQSLIRSLLPIEVVTKGPIHRPAETIRAAEVILETGDEIKGADKLKEVLSGIFN